MERRFSFEPGQYYHVFNRGVEKRNIFLDDADRSRFQNLLYLANGGRPIVFKLIQGLPLEKERGATRTSIIAYALMSNHFHIIAREDRDGGLSTFMSKLSTSYSMYFNTKYERSGSLLCHPFRAQHIYIDNYFRWALSYVHLNPLDIFAPRWRKKRRINAEHASDFLRSYKYSSYADYFIGERLETKIINKEALPIRMSEIESVQSMLEEFWDPLEDYETRTW